ncbi:hypothetical protein BHUM_05341 [Candidatus Burkholderia humilis]|nr:hypothetical protein BHUM_05341 [Candidatus Burkholderia humilis]
MKQASDLIQSYRNLAGNSGIAAYEIHRDGIVIRFINGGIYLYDDRAPGRAHAEEMKRLARSGQGLSTYISRFGSDYAEKIA